MHVCVCLFLCVCVYVSDVFVVHVTHYLHFKSDCWHIFFIAIVDLLLVLILLCACVRALRYVCVRVYLHAI
jgi:hypothetical protein